MDSDSLGGDAVPDERAAIPNTERCASVEAGPLQPEPIDRQGLEDDEIQTQIDLIKDFLESLQITRPEVVRVTQARHALWWFGRALREGHNGPDRYQQSEVRRHIAQFWSHSWRGKNTISKILLLLVVYNGLPAVLVGSVAFVSVRIYMQPELELRPMPNATAWSMLAGIVFSSLTLLTWPSRRRVFLDRICIHQKDERLKAEGMFNLAALLKYSQSMLVCWDPSYLHRMWCTVELAAYLKCHPDGQLIIRPVSWGPCTIAAFLTVAILLAVADILLEHFDSQAVAEAIAFFFAVSVMAFMYFTTVAARAHFRAASTVQEQLRTFSFRNDTSCYCCSVNHVNPKTGQRMFCDRQAIAGCLEHWFGSDTAFDAIVQQDVSAAFQRGVMSCLLPYAWLTGATVPIAWFGIHAGLQSLWWQGNANAWRLAFYNTLYVFCTWLGTIPVLVALWLRIPRCFQQHRSTRCREVMLNMACSVLMGIMFLVVRLAETAIMFAVGWSGILTCSAISVLAATICLGDLGRFFRRKAS